MIRTSLFTLCGVASAFAQSTTVGTLETISHVGAYLRHGTFANYGVARSGASLPWRGQPVRIAPSASEGPTRNRMSVQATLSRGANKIARAGLAAGGTVTVTRTPASIGTSNVLNIANAFARPVSVRFVHAFARGTKRDFNFEFTPRWSGGSRQTITASVDVDDNRTIEWTPTVTNGVTVRRTLSLTAGSNGIVIRLNLRADQSSTVAGRMSVSADLNYTFASGQLSCSVRSAGTSCGPQLRGSLASPLGPMTLRATGGTAKSVGIWMLGVRAVSLPIPGTSCFLHTPPLALDGHTFDASGAATLSFPLPTGLNGLLVWQDAVMTPTQTGLQLKTSQAVQLSCIER